MEQRKVVAKIDFPESFPDPRVESAYLSPEVNESTDPFIFGSPDLDALRRYMEKNLGWSVAKTDGILIPVMKESHKKQGTTPVVEQPRISDFFRPLFPSPTKRTSKTKKTTSSSLALSSSRVQSILQEWATSEDTSASPHFPTSTTTASADTEESDIL